MVVTAAFDQPSAPPMPPHIRKEGRLFVGRFLVPEDTFFLSAPCPACGGPAVHDEGDLRCLLCSRELLVAEISPTGRVLALGLARPKDAVLVRVASGQTRRTARAISRDDGSTGLAARVLRLVPTDANTYIVVEALSRALAVRRDLVRHALDGLESQGLVERFTFQGGYRVGWRRVPRELHEEVH